MTLVLLAIVVLVVINGLFVAAEFAIVGAPRTAIEKRADAGERLARGVHAVLEDSRRRDRYIATAQLGITLASLGLGMYGEHRVAEWLLEHLQQAGDLRVVTAHTLASIMAITVLTFVHIVFGEMIPKSVALQRAERAVLWITPIMRVFELLLYPLVVLLNGLGQLVLRLLGVSRRAQSADRLYSLQELALVVSESQAGGLLREESGQILRELFAFGELTAREVMTPRVRMAGMPVGADADTVVAIVRRQPFTRYPVYGRDHDDVIGVVHVADLLALTRRGESLDASLAGPIATVPETATLGAVLEALRRQRAQMALVIDEHGGAAGVLTHEDLYDEVVGEFGETALERTSIYRDAMNRLHVSGTARIEEAGEALGVALAHEDVDSVSGLVLTLLGRPPLVGDVVEFDHVRFEVVAVEGHGVREVIASRPAAPVPPSSGGAG
jgi:CBS domain containing-hemolysin-like protein